MKIKKPGYKDIIIFIESFIIFFLMVNHWDEVKLFITGIFQ